MANYLTYFLVDLLPILFYWGVLVLLTVPIALGFAPRLATALCQEFLSRFLQLIFPFSSDNQDDPDLPGDDDDFSFSDESITMQPILFPDINDVRLIDRSRRRRKRKTPEEDPGQSGGAPAGSGGAEPKRKAKRAHSPPPGEPEGIGSACARLHHLWLRIKLEHGYTIEVPLVLRYMLLLTTWWSLAFAGAIYWDMLVLDTTFSPEACGANDGMDCFTLQQIARDFSWLSDPIDCSDTNDTSSVVCYAFDFSPGDGLKAAVSFILSIVVIVALISLLQVYAKYFLVWCYEYFCFTGNQFFWCCVVTSEVFVFLWQLITCVVTLLCFGVLIAFYEPFRSYLLSDSGKIMQSVALIFTVVFTILTPWHMVEVVHGDKGEGEGAGDSVSNPLEARTSTA